jgi:hypothetical protein
MLTQAMEFCPAVIHGASALGMAWRASIGAALGLQGRGTGVDGVIAPGGAREAGG